MKRGLNDYKLKSVGEKEVGRVAGEEEEELEQEMEEGEDKRS